MFKTTVNDGSEKLGLKKEITETGRMNTNVRAFLVTVLLLDSQNLVTVELVGDANGLLGVSVNDGGLGNGDIFAVRVVEEFFTFVGHCVN